RLPERQVGLRRLFHHPEPVAEIVVSERQFASGIPRSWESRGDMLVQRHGAVMRVPRLCRETAGTEHKTQAQMAGCEFLRVRGCVWDRAWELLQAWHAAAVRLFRFAGAPRVAQAIALVVMGSRAVGVRRVQFPLPGGCHRVGGRAPELDGAVRAAGGERL